MRLLYLGAIATALLATSGVSAKAGNIPRLKGNVLYSQSWTQQSQRNGIYYLPTNPGERFELIHEGYYGTFGNFEQNGLYFTTERVKGEFLYTVMHTVWDAETGQFVNSFIVEGDCSQVAIDCAEDPVTGLMYAATFDWNGYDYQLSVLDFSEDSSESLKIGRFDCEIAALACSPDGQLYAITRERDADNKVIGSTLLKVNKDDASYEKIGDGTGCLPYFNSSATIDPESGRMFWTVSPADDSGSLYEVDLKTGKASLLCRFPGDEQVVGLQTAGKAAEDKAPATPVNLKVAFHEGSLSGTLTCDVPAFTYDGVPASGDVSYTVLIDDKVAGQGTATFGGSISYTLEVPDNGSHIFTVYLTNAVGDSPKTSVTAYVGYGEPSAPADVKADWADGVMSVTWSPVTTTVDGGFINPDEVRYTLRATDGNLIAENIAETSWSGPVSFPEKPMSYTYMVTAVNGGRLSGYTRSNTVSLGSLTPPLTTVFSQGPQTLAGYIVIDANKDNRTWIWDDGGHGLRAPYNTDHVTPMDDWLITPGLLLKAGNSYDLTFDASVMDATCAETFEVKMGRSNTAEAMTETLLTSTTIDNTDPNTFTARVVPTEDGTYYIGIHCISGADKYYLFIDNLSVSSPMASYVPDKPESLKVTPGLNGEYSALVELTAPTKDVQGEPLDNISRITVERNGETVHTFQSPVPGATLSFTDRPATNGRYTYTAAAYNADGRGLEASAEAVIGFDVPAVPTGLKVHETSRLGEVTAAWNNVTADHNGAPVPADKITYDVYLLNPFTGEWEVKASSLKVNTCTFSCIQDIEEQDIVRIGVAARTEGGSSEMCMAEPVAVGRPYEGLAESAADGRFSYLWTMDGTCVDMGVFYDNSLKSCSSSDGDNGYIFMRGDDFFQYGYLQSGKVTLPESAPALTFYTYNFVGNDGEGDINTIDVGLRVSGSEDDFVSVKEATVAQIAGNSKQPGWVRCHIPLDSYAGKTVELRFTGTIRSFSYVMLDNIVVGSMVDNDLSIYEARVPERVKAGSGFDMNFTVFNSGLRSASGWSLDLYRNDVKVDSYEGKTLASSESETVRFTQVMNPVDREGADYYAAISYTSDENTGNNGSRTFHVSASFPTYPGVSGLTATREDEGVRLVWTAPELSSEPQLVKEDFEKADDFAHDYSDWTFADLDNVEVGGFQEFTIPGIVNKETKSSFFVFNPDALGLPVSQFGAYSGSRYLASLVLWDDSQVDDWAISPELSGRSQTVNFQARSFQSAYPEKVEVLYSTESADPKDFKVINPASEVPANWTLFSAYLPEGARYFAIRSCASGNFMLMVDDVTYEAKALAEKFRLLGYNVYRNTVKVNEEPVTATGFMDTADAEGDCDYVVTAVFDCGESAPSDKVTVAASGLSEIGLGVDDADVRYYNLQGIPVAHPEKGGIYIRSSKGRTGKVIVR